MIAIFHRLICLLFPPRCVFCRSIIDEETLTPCPRCRDQLAWTLGDDQVQFGRNFSLCVSPAWYEGLIRQSMLRYKFYGRSDYAKCFAPYIADGIQTRLAGKFDLITWIPVSGETLKMRGYDQARLLAVETARILNKPIASTLIKVKHNIPQSSVSGLRNRRENVANIFSLSKETPSLKGLRVLLIDDTVTTGSTLEEGANVLLRAGATEVPAATFCRVRPPAESNLQNSSGKSRLE